MTKIILSGILLSTVVSLTVARVIEVKISTSNRRGTRNDIVRDKEADKGIPGVEASKEG